MLKGDTHLWRWHLIDLSAHLFSYTFLIIIERCDTASSFPSLCPGIGLHVHNYRITVYQSASDLFWCKITLQNPCKIVISLASKILSMSGDVSLIIQVITLLGRSHYTGYEGLNLQALTPRHTYQIWAWSRDLQN